MLLYVHIAAIDTIRGVQFRAMAKVARHSSSDDVPVLLQCHQLARHCRKEERDQAPVGGSGSLRLQTIPGDGQPVAQRQPHHHLLPEQNVDISRGFVRRTISR